MSISITVERNKNVIFLKVEKKIQALERGSNNLFALYRNTYGCRAVVGAGINSMFVQNRYSWLKQAILRALFLFQERFSIIKIILKFVKSKRSLISKCSSLVLARVNWVLSKVLSVSEARLASTS